MVVEPDEVQVQPAEEQEKRTQADIDAEEAKLQKICASLKVGKQLKSEGGALFKAGKFEEAVKKYQDADEAIGDTFLKTFTLFDESDSEEDDTVSPPYPAECLAARDETIDLTASCRVNAAICCGKLQRWEEAIKHTSSALKYTGDEAAGDGSGEKTHMMPTHIKALFNRGRAYAAMGKLTDAKADLTSAVKLDPKNRAAREELRKVKEQLKAKKVKMGFFGSEEEKDVNRNSGKDSKKDSVAMSSEGGRTGEETSREEGSKGSSRGGGEGSSRAASEGSSKGGSGETGDTAGGRMRRIGEAATDGDAADAGGANGGAIGAEKTGKQVSAGPAKKIGTDYGKWEKMEKEAETQEKVDKKNRGFVIPRNHIEWMAKEGWLPGTARYD
jgi:tetratricopeptide (TPR) repeat protein